MKLNYIILFTAIALLSGCTNDDKEPKVEQPNAVTLSGTKSTANLAGSNEFKDGSEVGIYITSAKAGLQQSGNHANNALFTATESEFTSTNVTYPESVTNLDFYAYAPYSSTNIDVNNEIEFSVEESQDAVEDSDLLWAKKTDVLSGSDPALVFDHKLSQIIIKLVADVGVTLDAPTVKIVNTLPTTEIDIEDGTIGAASGTIISIIPTSIANLEKWAIIVPQTVVSGTKFIVVNNGSKDFGYILDKDFIFQSGKSYTFTITVKNNSIDVNFTGSLSEWVPEAPSSGDAV